MESTFKKLLYAGVGLAAQTTEKFEKQIDELVEKGKIDDSEGKKIIDDLLDKTDSRKEEFEEKFNEMVGKFGYVRRKDFDDLKARLEELEAQVAPKAKKSAAKATA